MSGADDLVTWLVLGLIFAAVAVFYLWQLRAHTRALFTALIRLRDRIDRSQRW